MITEELMPTAWHAKDAGIFADMKMRKKKSNWLLLMGCKSMRQ